ncbi:MAG: glycerophosphodiester phosphodiesterase family protein [Bacteroidales bacterium]|nr:glycerophosphodiester phosphodiesterase family protein [Bacteroidales bacterium]
MNTTFSYCRRGVALLTALATFVSCSIQRPLYGSRAEAIAAQIQNPASEYVVVACHRGDWRNYPENSIPAIESIIRMGADMMELDIKMTADSVLVLSHDKDVLRCTNFSSVFRKQPGKSPLIKDLTYSEIKQLRLKRAHGVVTDSLHMPTLREALACCKGRICVNVDQGYAYYDRVQALAEELGMTGQVLIKGRATVAEVREKEAAYPNKLLYMPIVEIQQNAGMRLFKSYLEQGAVPLAYEVCWRSNGDGLFREVCRQIREQGSKIWVNTIWASLCGGYGNDDDAAFEADDPGRVYRQYLDLGVSMLQTDRPALLIGYLTRQGRHTLPPFQHK